MSQPPLSQSDSDCLDARALPACPLCHEPHARTRYGPLTVWACPQAPSDQIITTDTLALGLHALRHLFDHLDDLPETA